jgi:DNA-binding response OmpR family regulator
LDTRDLRLLYVEDEDEIRNSLSEAISDEFKSFITASNGQEGLKKFKKYKPDIVITDISMPVLDGLEMSKEIKATSCAPVIVLSAYSDKEKLLRAIDAGIDKYLIKPIDIDELMDVVAIIAKEKIAHIKKVDLGYGYSFDKEKKELYKDGNLIALTKKELLFVQVLIKNLGAFVMYDDLKKVVWQKRTSDAAIRTFVKRLRIKTDKDFIKNISGLGYKIVIRNK